MFLCCSLSVVLVIAVCREIVSKEGASSVFPRLCCAVLCCAVLCCVFSLCRAVPSDEDGSSQSRFHHGQTAVEVSSFASQRFGYGKAKYLKKEKPNGFSKT